MVNTSDGTAIRIPITHRPGGFGPPVPGQKRTTAVAITPAGSHSSASDQNPRRRMSSRVSMPLTIAPVRFSVKERPPKWTAGQRRETGDG